MTNLKTFVKIDWILMGIIALLITIGLTVLYGFDVSRANDLYFFKKQIIAIAIGFLLFFAINLIDYKILKTHCYLIYLIALIVMVSVLLIGIKVHGTRGWLIWGPLRVQPVEFAKLSMIIILARFFSKRSYNIKNWAFILRSGILVSPLFIFVLIQPDLGSAMSLLLIWISMLLVGGIRVKHMLIIGGMLLIVFLASWFLVFENYQKQRILTFINPKIDAQGAGYNIRQATIAVGSGGMEGRGLTESSQSQLRFLPEAHTDFIFASLAENFGFSGVIALLTLWGAFFYFFVFHLKSIKESFGFFLILGILIYFALQIFLNIAMNIGMAPITGLPLPLISYGGSSLVASLLMLGIAQNVLARNS